MTANLYVARLRKRNTCRRAWRALAFKKGTPPTEIETNPVEVKTKPIEVKTKPVEVTRPILSLPSKVQFTPQSEFKCPSASSNVEVDGPQDRWWGILAFDTTRSLDQAFEDMYMKLAYWENKIRIRHNKKVK